MLPILGPSGCGKSSLARAGLIPELARRPLPGRKRARVAIFTPGTHPVEALAGVLAKIATNDIAPVAKTREFASELKRVNDAKEYDCLRQIADLLPDITLSPLIVLVDQFEEVYSLCKEAKDRKAFIENLLHAAGARGGRVSVILTLRSDFLGETQKHPALNQAIAKQGVIVPAMSQDELERAIAKPAKLAGHSLDESTVKLLVEETEGREGALPLLQFALTQIWSGIRKGIEPADTLEKIGGVGGALAGEAERIFDSLSEEEKAIARRVFLGLVQLGEGAKDTRRRTKIDSLVSYTEKPEQVKKVIVRFASVNARLITVSGGDGTEKAEVTHEALFDHWSQLNEWLDSSRDDIRFQRRLEEAALNWEANKRSEGSLWRSPDLDLLKSYCQRAGSDMTPLQIDFFRASKRAEIKGKIFRWSGVAGLIALSGLAFWNASEANKQAKMAFARQLAATSEWIRSQRGDLHESSVLLAVESMKRFQQLEKPSLEADRALRNGLTLLPPSVARISHRGQVREVAFSADSQYLVTGSEDRTARLVKVSSGEEVARISHQGGVSQVAFSADSQYLATRSGDTVRVHFLWPQDLMTEACRRLQRNLTVEEWRTYIGTLLHLYEKTCRKNEIHPSLLEEGIELAREGKEKAALAIFRRAKKLEPDIDLNPETKNFIDKDPKAVVQQLRAPDS